MREGRIAHEGTLEEIAAAEPDLYSGYERAVQEMTDLESDAETDAESRKREMMQIRRQISRQQSCVRDEEVAETDGTVHQPAGYSLILYSSIITNLILHCSGF